MREVGARKHHGVAVLIVTFLLGFVCPAAHGTQLAAGLFDTCVALSSGHVDCWGANLGGQFGPGLAGPLDAPVEVEGVSAATQVASGSEHTCAVLSNGHVGCWGRNYDGQLGDGEAGESAVIVEAQGISDAVQVSAGFNFTCALLSTGNVDCWGDNSDGQLGDAGTANSDTPREVVGLTNVIGITAGREHTCAVLSNGHVNCWGNNTFGRLGDGSTSNSDTPVAVMGIGDATQVAAGGYHTCATLSTGHLTCWGDDISGQLGNGVTNRVFDTPVEVEGVTNAKQVSAGEEYSCALLASGEAMCWGWNEFGQLGDGTTTTSDTPQTVSEARNIAQLAAGSAHTCALLSTGLVSCWGWNYFAQLGDLTQGEPYTPVETKGITDATQLAGGGWHICALLTTGHAECWGYNTYGQLGDEATGNAQIPVATSNLSSATEIAAGAYHTCAVLESKHVDCWGDDFAGQLGQGAFTTPKAAPVEVPGIGEATQVAADAESTCVLLVSGHVMCWGWNHAGQLGNGSTAPSTAPVEVQSITDATSVVGGGEHMCALLATGSIVCWGENGSGQLGNGTTSNSATPVAVEGIDDATSLAAGRFHSCAVLSTGHIDCWGANGYGELGDGAPTGPVIAPVEVTGVSEASRVAAGGEHTCALLRGGHVECWGEDQWGQIGIKLPTGLESATAIDVPTITNANNVAAGEFYSCATLTTGGVTCWGDDFYGQLGDNAAWSAIPTEVAGLSTRPLMALTGVASSVSRSAEVLTATVNPGDEEVVGCLFEYGATTSYGSTAACVPSTISGTGPVAIASTIERLQSGSTYHYRIVVTTLNDVVDGSDGSFRTINVPAISDRAPSGVGEVSATLNATVDPEGATDTTCTFEFGPTTAYGTRVPCDPEPGSGLSPVAVTGAVTGLTPNTTYHYKIVATNAAGASETADQSFVTAEAGLPEVGRCLPAVTGGATYKDSACTTASVGGGTGHYEWRPWPALTNTVAVKGGPVTLETVTKGTIKCGTSDASGEFSGSRTVSLSLTFSGCEASRVAVGKCTSTGAHVGEIVTVPLAGDLGIVSNGKKPKVGWQLQPVSGTEIAVFRCESTEVSLGGSVIVPVSPIDAMGSTIKLAAKAKKGKQSPESFEHDAAAVLHLSVHGIEERAGLTMAATLAGEEATEIKAIP
jgi:alpha-tubulin suppressor-like RCC1 family protein